ncbi:MAG: hypothetical protein LBB90_12130 [Tannerella sp.]|jgi:hypothetical protein|nr:hypothetical protein [Tannerella sp.]
MKRTIATVLLLWMALSAMQPALAFHFCGGTLVSVGPADTERCCCGKETDEAAECPAPGDGITEPVQSCCYNYTVELSTDEFQTPPTPGCGKELSAACPVGLWAVGLSGYDVRNDAPLIQHLSPPGMPAASGTDRLALICTLRI